VLTTQAACSCLCKWG